MRVSRFALALAWLVVMLLFGQFEPEIAGGERRPAPIERPALPAPARIEPGPLAEPSRGDPSVEMEMAACEERCIGSAFSLDRDGLWMTARHVVEGCRSLGIATSARRALEVRAVQVHPEADVALMQTDRSGPALALSDAALQTGQDGYAFGYPQGTPGEVHGRLIGRLRVRITGEDRFVAPAIAWAEVSRIPDSLPELGGISGGPMVDASGQIIGVAIGASIRRGRVITAAPRSLLESLEQARVTLPPSPGGSRSVDTSNITRTGDALRRDLSVAQVYCVGGGGKRRPRPLF